MTTVSIDTLDGSDFTASTSDLNAGSLTLASNGASAASSSAGSVFITGTNTFNGLIDALKTSPPPQAT